MLSIQRRAQPRVEVPTRLEDHYGLAQRPFALTLDQAFVYPSRSYTRALQEVRRGIEQRDGLVVVTGETGTGKTMLCRTLVRGWDEQPDAPPYLSMVLDPHVTFDDLLLHVLTDFGVIRAAHAPGPAGSTLPMATAAPTRHQLVRALQQFVVSLIPTGGCAVIVIDEAQHLDCGVLEQLRLLLNLETNEAKLLQIVLVGDTGLTRMLQQPEMRQLDQRAARRCVLEPLGAPEVKRYIEHRLATAQRLGRVLDIDALERGDAIVELAPQKVPFTASAMRAVATESRGIPRMVNLLCDRALEIGHERRTNKIDARIVRAAARRVAARSSGSAHPRIATAVAASAAVALLATGVGAWQSMGYREAPAVPSPPPAFAALAGSHPEVLAATRTNVRPLEMSDSFNVRVASFKAEARATDLAARLVAAGLPAFVRSTGPQASRPRYQKGSAHVYHVTVGPYLLQTEAAAVREAVAGQGHSDAEVFIEPAALPRRAGPFGPGEGPFGPGEAIGEVRER